eukprot:3809181-Amphidinium_carterae.1
MGSLYEIGSLTTVFIHIDRQSPRHLKDFWSLIIDTGAAVSVCPMTFCEHIAVKTMPESTRRQYVTVTGEGLAISGWKELQRSDTCHWYNDDAGTLTRTM